MNSGCALIPASVKATASGSSRKIPHLEVHGGHAKRSFLVLVSHDEESPTAGSAKACGLRVSRLCGNESAFFGLQTQPQRSSPTLFFCSGGIFVLFSALMAVNLSTPAVGSV